MCASAVSILSIHRPPPPPPPHPPKIFLHPQLLRGVEHLAKLSSGLQHSRTMEEAIPLCLADNSVQAVVMRYGIELAKVVPNLLDANTVPRVAVLSFSGQILLQDRLVRLQVRIQHKYFNNIWRISPLISSSSPIFFFT